MGGSGDSTEILFGGFSEDRRRRWIDGRFIDGSGPSGTGIDPGFAPIFPDSALTLLGGSAVGARTSSWAIDATEPEVERNRGPLELVRLVAADLPSPVLRPLVRLSF